MCLPFYTGLENENLNIMIEIVKKMYKDILIISDNLWMAKQFESLIEQVNLGKLNWTFSISPYSNKQDFEDSLNHQVLVFNLKHKMVIDEIISKYDLVFSIHSKQFFPKNLVNSLKCINVHPGYNPINRGWYPQVFAIINDLPIGATIHEIDEKLDHGSIIVREKVVKYDWDTSLTLYNRVLKKEIELLNKYLQDIIQNNYKPFLPEDNSTVYLKKDFINLCELDMSKKQTIKETIDLLRSLTHGEYKNAYYFTKKNEKIYVSINLSSYKKKTPIKLKQDDNK